MKRSTLGLIILSILLFVLFFGLIIALIFPLSGDIAVNSDAKQADSLTTNSSPDRFLKKNTTEIRRKQPNSNIASSKELQDSHINLVEEVFQILENNSKLITTTDHFPILLTTTNETLETTTITTETTSTNNTAETTSTTNNIAETTSTTNNIAETTPATSVIGETTTTIEITSTARTIATTFENPKITSSSNHELLSILTRNKNTFSEPAPLPVSTDIVQTTRRHRNREKAVTLMLSQNLLRKFISKDRNAFLDVIPVEDKVVPFSTTQIMPTIAFPDKPVFVPDEITNLDSFEKKGISKIEVQISPFEEMHRKPLQMHPLRSYSLSPPTPMKRITTAMPFTTSTARSTTELVTKIVSTTSAEEIEEDKTSFSPESPLILSTPLPELKVSSTALPELIATSTALPKLMVTSTSIPESIDTTTALSELMVTSTIQSVVSTRPTVTTTDNMLPTLIPQLPIFSIHPQPVTTSNLSLHQLSLLTNIPIHSDGKISGLLMIDDILFVAKNTGKIELFNKTSYQYLADLKTNLSIYQINELSDDTIVISETKLNTLNLVNFSGTVIKKVVLPFKSKGMAVYQDMIFVLSNTNNQIYVYDEALQFIEIIKYDNPRNDICNFLAPSSDAFYIGCHLSILKIDYNGYLLSQLGFGEGSYGLGLKYHQPTHSLLAIQKGKTAIHIFNEDESSHVLLQFNNSNTTVWSDLAVTTDKIFVSDYNVGVVRLFEFPIIN